MTKLGRPYKLNPISKDAGRYRARTIYKIIECEKCGKQGKLVIHHIDKNTLNNDKTNIQILCYPHHQFAHKIEHVKAMKKKWGDTRWANNQRQILKSSEQRKKISGGMKVKRYGNPLPPKGSKFCPKCKKTLHITDFSKDRSRFSGLQTYCKKCNKMKYKKSII